MMPYHVTLDVTPCWTIATQFILSDSPEQTYICWPWISQASIPSSIANLPEILCMWHKRKDLCLWEFRCLPQERCLGMEFSSSSSDHMASVFLLITSHMSAYRLSERVPSRWWEVRETSVWEVAQALSQCLLHFPLMKVPCISCLLQRYQTVEFRSIHLAFTEQTQ